MLKKKLHTWYQSKPRESVLQAIPEKKNTKRMLVPFTLFLL